jgi:hypothetical protein
LIGAGNRPFVRHDRHREHLGLRWCFGHTGGRHMVQIEGRRTLFSDARVVGDGLIVAVSVDRAAH